MFSCRFHGIQCVQIRLNWKNRIQQSAYRLLGNRITTNDAWYVCIYFKLCVKPLQLSQRNARQNAEKSAPPKICLINKLSARRKKFTSKTILNEQKSAARMNTWQNHTNTQYNNKVHGKPCPWRKSICCMPMCCVVFRSIYRCHFVNCSAWCYIVGVVFAPFVNFIEKLHKFAFE